MAKKRKFVIGDIHSHYDEMMELFKVVQFDFENDLLISLGDLVDRGPKPIEVIEKLMTVKNFIHILGNHDEWCFQYLSNNEALDYWEIQGGLTTLEAYAKHPEYKKKHRAFFGKARLYHIDDENRLFVHGGFNPEIPFEKQRDKKDVLIWDRSLIRTAQKYEQNNKTIQDFSEIFVGHTPTQLIGENKPKKFSNIWMIDTGVYLSGKLTIMNIETREFWQSSNQSNQTQQDQ